MKLWITLVMIGFPGSVFAACPGTPSDCYTGTATAGLDTLTVNDCSYAAVNATVGATTDGDTVIVPACAETTWDSQLLITKGITLQGAGIGSTNIKGTTGATYLIKYYPSAPQNNTPFILTGFTFNLNSDTSAVYLTNPTITYPINKVRIHHNTFTNCTSPTFEIDGTNGIFILFVAVQYKPSQLTVEG